MILGHAPWVWVLAAGCLLLLGWEAVVVIAALVRVRLPPNPPCLEEGPPLVVLVACKGETEHSRAFFEHLMAQRYRPFRVILAVESAEDTALGLMRLAGMAERTETVVAGLTEKESQKVANMIAGLARLRPEDELLVIADADHLPPPDWLGQLAAPLVTGGAAVVSGYRLMVPRRPRLGACLAAAMDAAVVTAPRPTFHALCWGGSTAARLRTWDSVGFRDGLRGSFNDDVMASQLFHEAGIKVTTPRHMMLPIAAEHSLRRLLNFVPRQYMQVRWYAPFNRWASRLLLPLPVLGWAAAVAAAATGHGWGWAVLALAFAAAAAKAGLRRSLVRRIAGAAAAERWRCAFWLTCLAPPLLALLHCALGYVGLFGRTVVWAGTRYRIDAPKRVKVLARQPGVSA